MGFWNSGNFFMLFTGSIVVCGTVIGVTAYATSQASFDHYLAYTQESKIYDMGRDSMGYYHPSIAAANGCTQCSKVHGAPGPEMGAAGAPLLIGYLLWRRRRKHRPA
jgi:MYXO-CTERM domain-containing protein